MDLDGSVLANVSVLKCTEYLLILFRDSCPISILCSCCSRPVV